MRIHLVALALLAAGCSSPGSEEPFVPSDVTFSDVQAVFDKHCTSCHRYGMDLDLQSPGTRARVLAQTTPCWNPETGEGFEKAVVVPGDPAASSMWHKLANVDLHCGREMPPTGTGGLVEISTADFNVVEAWILSGAGE